MRCTGRWGEHKKMPEVVCTCIASIYTLIKFAAVLPHLFCILILFYCIFNCTYFHYFCCYCITRKPCYRRETAHAMPIR